jgi:purine catabolism regulator
LKGGEIALVGTDVLERQELPVTMADVVRQLGTRGASGVAVRGDVNAQAIAAAEGTGLPLLHLPDDISLHDVEQQIMRECALFQARQEMMAGEQPGAWVGRLLIGQIMTFIEAQGPARREGYTLGASYAVALVKPEPEEGAAQRILDHVASALGEHGRKSEPCIISHPFEDGLAVLVPPGREDDLSAAVRGQGLACGLGRERPLMEAPVSLEEARLALLSSVKLHGGDLVAYDNLGAERMLLLLYLHDKAELESFVEETLGPLLRHDAKTASPLMPTILLFLGHGGRLRETAADMYVHRNTLAYRLDRAAEILGADLKDADVRLAVEIALRALPLVRSENGARPTGRHS